MDFSAQGITESFSNELQPVFQKTWVQCDKTPCKKWRRITNREAGTITDDANWFCCMNEDAAHNKCEDPEEKYKSAEELARQFGIKYITSPLCEGTIVWAKVHGYCWWPAIVCEDPDANQSSFQSVDGDTLCYHVEFLGKKHCHGVIRVPLVSEYVSDNKSAEMSPKLPNDIQSKLGRKKKSGKGPKKTPKYGSSLKYEYQGGSVQTAIEEANSLLKLPIAERMDCVVFRPKGKSEKGTYPTNDETLTERVKEEKDPEGFCRTPTMSPQMASMHLKKCFSSPAMSDRCGKRKRYVEGKGSSASLVNRSKEEKFALDLQAYQRNEKAFEHDLKRYWERMGQPLTKIPDWQGEPVKLFTMFSAVNDRGGYEQVCRTDGGWQRIYQETTNSNVVKQGVKAKTFYIKCLLPFQLYLQGKDYNQYLSYLQGTDDKTAKRLLDRIKDNRGNIKRRGTPDKNKSDVSTSSAQKKSRQRRKNSNPSPRAATPNKFYDENVGFSYILSRPPENERTESHLDHNRDADWREMEEMIRSMPAFTERAATTRDSSIEQHERKTIDEGGKNPEPNDGKVDNTDMEVVFYEDNTPEFRPRNEWERGFLTAETCSEFGNSHLSREGGQRVPSVSGSRSSADGGGNDQVLHEMEAVQDEIDDIHQQLMML